MYFQTHYSRGRAVALAVVFLFASVSQGRDRDGNNGGGGHSDGGGRSSASSDSGGASSGRSFSSGDSSRSFSSGSSRSFSSDSSRSSTGGSIQSFGSRSPQSFQMPSTSDRSVRSFGDSSRGSWSNGNAFSGRQFSGQNQSNSTSGTNSATVRSFGSRTVAKPVDAATPSGDWSNRGSGNSGVPYRANSQGGDSGSDSSNRSARTFNNNVNNSSQTNRFNSPGVISQNNSPNNSSIGARNDRGASNQSNEQNLSNSVTKARLEAFLQSRRDNGLTQTGAVTDRFNRNGGLADSGRNVPNVFKQADSQNGITDSRTKGDQAWARKFGNTSDKLNNRSSADKSLFTANNKDALQGIVNLQDARRRLADRKLDPKNFDPQKIDRNYQDWRKDASSGKSKGLTDQRDWSGEWKKGDRFAAADGIRDYWKKNHDAKDTPFKGDWWKNHDHHDGHDGNNGHNDHNGHDNHSGHDGRDGNHGNNNHDHGHDGHDGHWDHWDHWGHFDRHHRNWWSWCSAPALTAWFDFGFPTASYWDYGPGEYIFCNNGVVYVNGVWFEPAPIFYRRTLLLAQAAPVWTPEQAAAVEWLPLGVFAVARDGAVDINLLVQLAVTKDGVLGGTLFNQLTGVTFPIQGTVDRDSQRAVWMFTDDTGAQIVMESSIFNLTQPEATGLVHYGPDNIQVIELVRLEDPNPIP